MRELKIKGTTGDSILYIGESLKNLKDYIPPVKTVIITDRNVKQVYQKHFPPAEIIEIGMGEEIKNLDTVRMIYEKLIELEMDRSSFVVGIGGGIVCDITGFVASTYLRGVRFGFVSSTLLSQVDASVGGKNGVNFAGYKNMVGVFNQPEFVICDIDLLKTLPKKEVLSGLAEIVKHAAIGNKTLFSFLETHDDKALRLDYEVIERLVWDSVQLKSSVVNRDEKEAGERRILNFGHTFGHAIEKTLGVRHGEAISMGMVIASALSEKRGHLLAEDTKRVESLLKRLGLPTRLQFNREKVIEALRKDKKRQSEDIHFVLLQSLGHAIVEKISIKELETTMDWMLDI